MVERFDQVIKKLLKEQEGIKKFPYSDTKGKITIGVGRNLTDRGLSSNEIEYLLENDIIEAQNFIRTIIVGYDKLSENRKAVLVSMYHNLGPGGFRSFKRMIKAVNEGDFKAAAEEILNSEAAFELTNRYAELATMMELGE